MWTEEFTEALKSGGTIFSWYNDSGFWLVKEIGGLTLGETLTLLVATAVSTL